ncbi:MAG TPA: hypothetical protein VHB02_19500 [Acidimicrobiales bacterium]|nr:hypothetical protein [Acidimicrobiales bacterium]
MDAEGWYKDPYGQHEDRWFSAGAPTKLVRDGQVEASDPPPDVPPPGPLVPADPHGPDLGAADLLRADAAEAGTATRDHDRENMVTIEYGAMMAPLPVILQEDPLKPEPSS